MLHETGTCGIPFRLAHAVLHNSWTNEFNSEN